MMNKKIRYFWLLFLPIIFAPLKTMAMCPVCAVAVGAGIGFSKWLGVDDVITGLWIGGLIVSMIMWTINWLENKKYNFRGSSLVIILVYYGMILIPLYLEGYIGHLNAVFLVFDKLSLGIIIGSLVFWLVSLWYLNLKKKNGGHAYFPFQKVVMPVGALALANLIIYLIIKFI